MRRYVRLYLRESEVRSLQGLLSYSVTNGFANDQDLATLVKVNKLIRELDNARPE